MTRGKDLQEGPWGAARVGMGSGSDVSGTDTWSSARRVGAHSGSLPPTRTAPNAGPQPGTRDAGSGGSSERRWA